MELLRPTKDITVYPNNKPNVTKDIKGVIHLRKVAFMNKDIKALKQTERVQNDTKGNKRSS